MIKRLDTLEIVDRHPEERDKIFFGACVLIEDEHGGRRQVQIVGADEFDLKKSWIILNSPIARALSGKRQGTDIHFRPPEGEQALYE